MSSSKDNINNNNSQIKLTVNISGFNYADTVRLFTPHILSEVSKVKHAEAFTDILSANAEFTEAALTYAIDAMPQNMKDMLAVNAINEFESNVIDFLLAFISKENIKISIIGLKAYSDGDGVKINIFIDNIDYVTAVEKLIPFYESIKSNGTESEQTKQGKTWSLANIIKKGDQKSESQIQQKIDKIAWTAAKLAIMAFPKAKKDEIAVNAVNVSKSELAESMEKFILSKGIELTVNDITAVQIGVCDEVTPASTDMNT